MKKKILSLLLALVMCLGLLPVGVSAAQTDLPDWYFLFAAFKNIDADGRDRDGKAVHVKYSMTQDEVAVIRDNAREFEAYMNSLGVMRAHVDVVEIDDLLTELHDRDSGGSYVGQEQAAPLLKRKVDLDKYDHVTCVVSFDNLAVRYYGLSSSPFENGTGHSCVNLVNRENALSAFTPSTVRWQPTTLYVHEYLHFAENLGKRFGAAFDLHGIQAVYNTSNVDDWKGCYTDIILNRVKGNAETGTGVHPAVWQYPPHVLRTMTELTIPSDVTSIGHDAFLNYTNLTSVTIPSSVTSISEWTFANCSALTRISIPVSVTTIGGAAFQKAGVTDVYYAGTEEQWKAVEINGYNGPLTRANVHCSHLMADVKTTDWFAQPVLWALERGITVGTGEGAFSPGAPCTQGQILTFLWRAKGCPAPAGAVTGGAYYAEALQWAQEQGLVDKSLSVSAPCVRADVVTYLWKLAGSPAADASGFTDVPAGAAYTQAVSWAVSRGITTGTGGGTFSPNSTCTRGQIVSFLYRALR